MILSGQFNTTLTEVTTEWSYHELQTALDLLEALDASRAEARAERDRPKD